MSLLEIYGDEPFDIFFDEFGVDVEIIQKKDLPHSQQEEYWKRRAKKIRPVIM